ncbi:hypothetical protein CAP37_08400 [Hydrogenophaga sp. IBVHS1]|nr:hypothetical protein CAP37_08400 [Hydrogenophaga sp. IBVHS1]
MGDPTIGGWVTVALYIVVAVACHKVLRLERQRRLVSSDHERLIWRLLTVGVILLGINKQLDLQSAATELARMLAHEYGWYRNRRQYQEAFIAASAVLALTSLAALAVLAWNAPVPTLWACTGATGLTVFVGIRAASFHHIDEMLGWTLGGLPLNWLLEMGSLMVIGWSARTRVKGRT